MKNRFPVVALLLISGCTTTQTNRIPDHMKSLSSAEQSESYDYVMGTPKSEELTIEDDVKLPSIIYAPKIHLKSSYEVIPSVTLAFLIGKHGEIEKVSILASTNSELNSLILEQAKSWKFKGGIVNGEPARFKVISDVVFRIM